jgi:hypothetical protein
VGLQDNEQQRFVVALTGQLTKGLDRVIPGEWAGGMLEEMALPQGQVRFALRSLASSRSEVFNVNAKGEAAFRSRVQGNET